MTFQSAARTPASGPGWDVITVGGGPAGVVCAVRCAAAGLSTLLIEAGPDGAHPRGRRGLVPPSGDDPWYWPPVPETSAGDGASDYWIGRGLGGGSAVNGMVLSVGSPDDYDRWASDGGPAWAWADMAPWFDRAIAVVQPEVSADPVPGSPVGEFLARFDNRCRARGWSSSHRSTIDAGARGLLRPALATVGGRRRSVADAYLPLASGGDLTVWTDTTVDRLMIDRGRATGVRTSQGNVASGRVTVLAAGSIGTPRLLYRSGLWSNEAATARNHPAVVVPVSWPDGPAGGYESPRVHRVLRWRVNDAGVEAQLIGPFRSGRVATGAVVVMLLSPTTGWSLDPTGRRGPMVAGQPMTRDDRRNLGRAADRVRALVGDLPGARGSAPDGADGLMETGTASGPVYHLVGTCPMGSSPGRLVHSAPDTVGSFRGVQGLVLADSSIFPHHVSGGPQLAVMAVAERAAAALTARLG